LAGGTQYTHDKMFQDTWQYNPHNGNWTWANGPMGDDRSSHGVTCVPDSANKFGPRYENRATWKHCQDLIITYNGFTDWNQDTTIVSSNEMWGYKISTSEWTKLNAWPDAGHYGQLGITNNINAPPSRFGGVGFTGKDAGMWLFGGQSIYGYYS